MKVSITPCIIYLNIRHLNLNKLSSKRKKEMKITVHLIIKQHILQKKHANDILEFIKIVYFFPLK